MPNKISVTQAQASKETAGTLVRRGLEYCVFSRSSSHILRARTLLADKLRGSYRVQTHGSGR